MIVMVEYGGTILHNSMPLKSPYQRLGDLFKDATTQTTHTLNDFTCSTMCMLCNRQHPTAAQKVLHWE